VACVFISYRRDDSAATCGRIYDRLVMRYGREAVFKDVDSIPLAVDFRQYVDSVMAQCTATLVVIGPQWLNIRGTSGVRRLDDPNDPVRLEAEAGLQRRLAVIPVLVQGARMPDSESLPPSIRELAMLNGIAVRYDPDFDHDMGKLIAALDRLIAPRTNASPSEAQPFAPQGASGIPPAAPAPNQTGISVTLRHNQLNVFYEATTPTVAIDGREYPCKWGTHFFPAPSGVHSIEIWFRYMARSRSGFASVKVTVAPGQASAVEYDMPYLSTAKPSVRVVP
jgi:hypothetical protein